MPCEFVRNIEQADDLVSGAVAQLAFDDGISPTKAWRTHLELTQADVPRRMGITQSAYAQLEANATASARPWRSHST